MLVFVLVVPFQFLVPKCPTFFIFLVIFQTFWFIIFSIFCIKLSKQMIIYIFHHILDNLKFCRTFMVVGNYGVLHFLPLWITSVCGERTGLVVRALDSGSGDPGSILGRVGVLFP